MNDDWSLKGRKRYISKFVDFKPYKLNYNAIGIYFEEDIETLREKLIEDIVGFCEKRRELASEELNKYGWWYDDEFSVKKNCKDKIEAYKFGEAYARHCAYDLIIRVVKEIINKRFGVDEEG